MIRRWASSQWGRKQTYESGLDSQLCSTVKLISNGCVRPVCGENLIHNYEDTNLN